MPFQPKDNLLAFKHISMSDLLNGAEKQFAGFLIDSYNRKTGRCDPSEETAAHILQVSTRTIVRAGNGLVARKFFFKRKHGGNHHCNSYEPNWEMFRALEERYNQRRKRWSERFHRPTVSPSLCQPCHSQDDSPATAKCQPGHPDSDNSVTQTSSSNHIESTCASNIITSTLSQGVSKRHVAGRDRVRFASKEVDRDAANRNYGLERAAAEAAAERRWNNDLLLHFRLAPSTYAAIVEAIGPRLQVEATAAELRQKGSGLAQIVSELSARGMLKEIDGSSKD